MSSEKPPETGAFRVDQHVKIGSGEHIIWRFKRQYGIDGALVMAVRREPGDGWSPHWVALTSMTPWSADQA